MDKGEWKAVWNATLELVKEHEDIVVIGGVAVYVHTMAYNSKELAVEYTHDVDMAIDLPTLQQLTEEYEVVTNHRLHKRQLNIGNVEVDIYVSHQATLRVTYDELATWSRSSEGVRVACLSHLLLLKLDALVARGASSHGQKDRRDVAKILVMLWGLFEEDDEDNEEEFEMLVASVTDADVALIVEVSRSNAFAEIAKRNAKVASKLRKAADGTIDAIQELRADL